jgi:hypothetical protein
MLYILTPSSNVDMVLLVQRAAFYGSDASASRSIYPGSLTAERAAASPSTAPRSSDMAKKPAGRIGGRDNDSGQFVPLKETHQRPKDTTREVIPNPGHGDTGRYDKPKNK